jgi:hypothetical protein
MCRSSRRGNRRSSAISRRRSRLKIEPKGFIGRFRRAPSRAGILTATITHKHLTPWLSSVYVPIEHRGKGIASALSLHAVTEAARLGFERLYLFTPHNETLYARIGWRTFERAEYNGLTLTLMERQTEG